MHVVVIASGQCCFGLCIAGSVYPFPSTSSQGGKIIDSITVIKDALGRDVSNN